MTAAELGRLVRSVPDYPAAGIVFRDLSPLLADAGALNAVVEALARDVRAASATKVAGIEARGFIFGAAVAIAAGCGFVAIRKPGKLPVPAIGVDYALEYGADRLELDPTIIEAGERVAIVDDLIATGGTALAAAELIEQAGGAPPVAAAFVIDLPGLGGAAALRERGIPVTALLSYP